MPPEEPEIVGEITDIEIIAVNTLSVICHAYAGSMVGNVGASSKAEPMSLKKECPYLLKFIGTNVVVLGVAR